MGQKTHPIGLRLGVIKGWDSNWYCGKDTAKNIGEDDKIRKYLNARLGSKAGISKIGIERSIKLVTVTIFTARPGIIIGKGGTEVEKLKEEVKKLIGKEIQINISEIKRPELDAYIVASSIAKQIEGRVAYRRAMKKAVQDTMRVGAEGIKVIASGRIGGAEIARAESIKEGRIPLHTLRADIDYSLVEAHTSYGRIGIKVWICKGEVYGRPELVPTSSQPAANKKQGGAERKPNGGAPRRNKRPSNNK
ncbi:MAG: 30S ribosomal protein S3 [Bacteroidales bacterium]|nr:30S ribosomal protein S3 [Bacteroidales bacterium]